MPKSECNVEIKKTVSVKKNKEDVLVVTLVTREAGIKTVVTDKESVGAESTP